MADSPWGGNRPDSLGLRLVVSLVFLALAVIATVTFLIALGALSPDQVSGRWDFGYQILLLIDGLSWQTQALTAVGGALSALLFSAVTVRQWIPRGRSPSFHMLDADERGFVVVESRGVAVVAEQAAMSTVGVIGAAAEIKGGGTTPVRVRVHLEVYPGANIKKAGTQVREAVARAMEELIGLEVQNITVSARVIETDAMVRVLA